MAMSLRVRRLKEAYRLLPLLSAGNMYNLPGKDGILRRPLLNCSKNSRVDINTMCLYRCHQDHRYSTISEAVSEPLVQLDLPSFIKSTIDKPEGPSHCWFNGIPDKKSLKDGIFLVLIAGFVNSSSITEANFVSMLEKVKFLQDRYPFLQIIGFQDMKIPLCSSDICTHLLGRTLKEYIAFPILLANKNVLEIACEACYVLFNGSESSSIYYGKEADIVILDKAIKDFRAQESETPKIMHNLASTWVKPTDDFKEPPLCFPLRNLLLYFPGGISVDESGNRLFLSDSNHHRVIVLDGNGKILDSIGSSPGHEDGEFESAKLRRPAASFYHAAEDCLYLVDSENHAIRRADMGRRVVDTLYPRSKTNKDSSIWSWILGKLWPRNDLAAQSEELNPDALLFPWHILKSPNGDLLIFNRSCETLWIMDLASGLIREVIKGFSNILEICEPLILEKSMLLNQIPNDWLQQQVDAHCLSKRIPYVELISSVVTFQDQILICDTVGQTVLKLNRNSGSLSSFQFSNLGILGFPYWSSSPLERVCAADAALAANSIDHIESFNLLPGKIDIRLDVDIPEYVDLIEPLGESCIWRLTRGAATEISEADSTITSSEKVGIAQQWYDEIDHLAFSTSEIAATIEEATISRGEEIPEGKVEISCSVNSSPGTSEVIICAALYLRLKKDSDGRSDSRQRKAARIADLLNPGTMVSRDVILQFLLASKRDVEEIIITRPVHVRLKFDCPNHPKADNSKDLILTDTSLNVNVALK
ncbi:hypothetical protein AABB24_015843 [Solanum stoloniferum]|uniref:NHL repeat-containing protein n=1 Tax=Solanum stoloniferum TaxID=62892 RepID=A0ABD2TT81_9SOLN|nr:uncharacterized protein LOC125825523 [Solanum verrucosum]